jgi:formylglycine-generating enzyme required for sulfatase activity
MARDPTERYADTQAFAEDLRAYLENRDVAAYETGAVAELRKWVSRTRSLAAASTAGIAILVVGLVVSWSLYATARSETVRADAKTEDLRVANVALADATLRAEEKAAEAERERRTAEQRAEDVLSLSAAKDLQELILASDALWPAREEKIAAFEAWIRNARALIEGQPADPEYDRKARPGLRDHRAKLDQLRLRALPPSLEGIALVGEIPPRRAWNFEDPDDRWWHTQLVELIADLEAFSDPAAGLLSEGTDTARGWGVIRRLSFARSLREASQDAPVARARWTEAIASIADPRGSLPYAGLRIQPQLGLVPIGRDPTSGLHEFAHLETGEPAERDEDGRLLRDEGTGLVFVLVSGGSFLMGSQAADPAGPHYDPDSQKNEAPVHPVSLDAYFLSKFEMTQGQWIRFAGRNPSVYGLGTMFAGIPTTLMHPVENVTWQECTALLARMELTLPTEAQWEYATRAGTITPWWTGANKESLAGVANLSDGFSKRNGGPSIWKYDEDFDDGHTVHAPIGRFRANGFGLHDVLGNVNELCREGYGLYDRPEREHDGLRPDTEAASKMIRGGSFVSLPVRRRSAARWGVTPSYRDFATGLRPARALDR